jgi:multicomponent Na+:H+ antiporter subunit E
MIGYFLLNLLLAVLFVALIGEVSLLTILGGMIIGMIIVAMLARGSGKRGYGSRVLTVCRFLVYFIYILIKANIEVAIEIITPRFTMKPRLIRYDVSDLTNAETTTLANAITLTPGTLSADITDDGSTLYIHCMYAEDRDAAVAELDELRCKLMREVFGHDI